MKQVKSILIWAAIMLLILFWLPMLAIRRIFDRDPSRYKTGKLFRKLGLAISRVNPNWKIQIEGAENIDDRNPYIVVSNHLSNADIPVISNLPWEMKWVAKEELFNLPIAGWMMKMSGDIPVNRSSNNKRIGVFLRCSKYLEQKVSVMFFPEGTRSRTGKLNKFAPGAFELAIREKIPVLPIVLDGTQKCLPKKSWVFKGSANVKLKVLEPVHTGSLKEEDGIELMNQIREQIAQQLSEWRNVPISEVDATLG